MGSDLPHGPNEDDAPRCRRFRITGRVQGVFFRASTRDIARRLSLSGHAINLADGSVEVLACGDPAALAKLRDWLEHGPRRAVVEKVETRDCDSHCEAPADFTTG